MNLGLSPLLFYLYSDPFALSDRFAEARGE
jgi:hypothetical protein